MPGPPTSATNTVVAEPIGVSRQPQQLIVTVFALYGREPLRAIAVSDLISLMADLGVDHQAVRSALTRLKKRQVLLSTRENGVASYVLNPDLEDVFREGDERIFSPRRSRPGDPWLLVAFSVPESKRHLRHRIRRILAQRGFGTVSSGLWIAPAFMVHHVRRQLDREGLLEFVEVFVAEHITSDHVEKKLTEWWDTSALIELYAGFIASFEPVRTRWNGRHMSATDLPAAFGDYVDTITAWRRLPFLDPGLPLEFLAEDWHGLSGERLFADIHRLLAEPARRHAQSVLGA